MESWSTTESFKFHRNSARRTCFDHPQWEVNHLVWGSCFAHLNLNYVNTPVKLTWLLTLGTSLAPKLGYVYVEIPIIFEQPKFFKTIKKHHVGQISIIPKPELRGFWVDSPTKPPFKVTSAEVVLIKQHHWNKGSLVANAFLQPFGLNWTWLLLSRNVSP